jgi:glyceraldehyde 3-phosphate dehydrogenase
MTKLAINGFGRIGRAACKIALERPDVDVVAINDLGDLPTLVYLLKYDTVYGRYDKKVTSVGDSLKVGDKKIKVFSEKDPAQLPWGELGIDVVLECTGVFTKAKDMEAHLRGGARKVLLSAPSSEKDPVPTYIRGVNDDQYAGEKIIDMASCTTNCIAPVMKVMQDEFGIAKSLMVTAHAYTATQLLVDGPDKKDHRRGRAGAANSVPSTTGAAIATTKAIPALKGKFDGTAVRIPVICGSISDITLLLKRRTTVAEVNEKLTAAAQGKMSDVLGVSEEEIVSSDIIGTTESSIVDLPLTKVVDGDLVKIVAWYDNEWAYSVRLIEMAEKISTK